MRQILVVSPLLTLFGITSKHTSSTTRGSQSQKRMALLSLDGQLFDKLVGRLESLQGENDGLRAGRGREAQTAQPCLRVLTVCGLFDVRGYGNVRDEVVGLGVWEVGGNCCGYQGLDYVVEGRGEWWDDPERGAWHFGVWVREMCWKCGESRLRERGCPIQYIILTLMQSSSHEGGGNGSTEDLTPSVKLAGSSKGFLALVAEMEKLPCANSSTTSRANHRTRHKLALPKGDN